MSTNLTERHLGELLGSALHSLGEPPFGRFAEIILKVMLR